MKPDTGLATVWTANRPVGFWIQIKVFKVLLRRNTGAHAHFLSEVARRLAPCRVCGGAAKVIACIEDPVIIKKILNHLEEKAPTDSGVQIPDSRAPPHQQ